MPAPTHLRPHSETLANGLRVILRHAPNLKRSAAALRVAAGSHDVPLAWPGLAHFLEHLLFLGTERFPATQGLMPYVQSHGGQVNASTRERTTDFFFELPTRAFAGGLERLSDMLAHPRMNLDDQLREREVLQAEFVAWSQDATAQQQMALYDGLSAAHPLRGFHAGNRDSLPVDNPAFQQALKDFHQQFYRTGQMTLSLTGPQSLEALRLLAEQFAAGLPVGDKFSQAATVPLMDGPPKSYQQATERQVNWLFAFENLPDSAGDALAFLCHWINSPKPGGLHAHLQQLNLAEGVIAKPLYRFARQALLHIQFTANAESATVIGEQLLDWLGFFAARQDWPALREEYATLLQRQQQVSGALQLARLEDSSLSESAVAALKQILKEMGAVDNFSTHWQLPGANPFLRSTEPPANAGLIRGQTSAHRGLRTFAQDRSRNRREHSAMQFSQVLPDNTSEGAVYVRWVLARAPDADLQYRLEEIIEDARQAGVELSFTCAGNQCVLKLTGLQELMPGVLEHALKILTQPDADSVKQAPQTLLIPIRQLLQVLPDHCLEPAATVVDTPSLWTTARWDGLALGLSHQTQAAMGLALSRIPGVPDNQLPAPAAISGLRLWDQIDCTSTEHAILLFCPTASRAIADEAAWRLLAHLIQTPFYQRLRVELQLGYAVFSSLRQIHGQTGILFGVQSPNVAPAALLEHLQQVVDSLPAIIGNLDDSSLSEQRQALADQIDERNLSFKEAAELLWQAKLAGHSSEYLSQLASALGQLDRAKLLASAQQLIDAAGGWRCLATSPTPGAPWQAAK
ncbi:pyrroloquinoline quinone biosynthesis protein PqqF [Pseudomonas syringae]|nr:pyrroloquinoline quinone biosynthesis protein PqqF [Pseudomonas syringae]MCF5067353.1 pyrroloquinoline quinone biosynthesis protein PqqF [Pseudomonas syringae]